MDKWTDFERHVILKLEELSVAVATLKVQASIWGLLGGAIPVVILLIVRAFAK